MKLVVYFSMEYVFYELLFIYLGGFGVLVGDYCKSVFDFGLFFIVVGMLFL